MQPDGIISQIKKKIRNTELFIMEREAAKQNSYDHMKKIILDEKRKLRQPIAQQLKDHQVKYDVHQLMSKQTRSFSQIQPIKLEIHPKRVSKRYSELVQSVINAFPKKVKSCKQSPAKVDEKEILQILKPVDKYLIKKLEKILNIKPRVFEFSEEEIHSLPKTCSVQKIPELPIIRKPYIDYTKDLKLKKPVFKVDEWKSIQECDISQEEKIQRTMSQIQEIKQKAIQLEKYLGGKLNFQREREFDDLLINRVQAQVQVLNSFS